MSIPDRLKTKRVEIDFPNFGVENFDIYPRYCVSRPLGSGAYGFVVEAKDLEAKEGESPVVAIKKLPGIFRHPRLTLCALREIAVLRHFQHSNILGILDIIVPFCDNGKPSGDVYLVTEKMDMDLGELLSTPTEIDADQRGFFMYQVLRGLKAVQSAQVLHRDLKPQNLLITENCDLKICDFGLARGYEESGMTRHVTSQWYRAPEVLLDMAAKPDDDPNAATAVYDVSMDIWSTGCILAEMMLRRPVFRGRANTMSQIDQIFDILGTPAPSPDLPAHINDFLKQRQASRMPGRPWDEVLEGNFEASEKDMVAKMLMFNSEHRITVNDALTHPYLKDFHDPSDEPTANIFTFPSVDKDPSLALCRQFAEFHPEVRELIPDL
eukprot:TRINITY_DN18224_c0_g1_i1.p1 TRINITY_DN18224_c0_g1~~TRINITY_DN18224_c0_g1_i1.p1  ORF type:complete len:381 (-),score=66.69 TRINITY_DN18224_c0_g1_i1:139-1281(-)